MGAMAENTNNLNNLINSLLDKGKDFKYIGNAFFESLKIRKNDILAYDKTNILESNYNNVKSTIIRKIKNYFIDLNTQDEESELTNIEFLITPKKLNSNSLLGIVNSLVQEEGEEILEDIGKAVYEGTKEYLKKNPLAKENNFYQFKEYKAIFKELLKL